MVSVTYCVPELTYGVRELGHGGEDEGDGGDDHHGHRHKGGDLKYNFLLIHKEIILREMCASWV